MQKVELIERFWPTLMRNVRIDNVKGLAIVAMVLGHSGAPFTPFLYLFHMAIFLIASGYCFNSDYSNDIKKVKSFIIRRIKGLYIPYLFWTILFLLGHNLFIKINIYTNNPIISEYVSEEYVVLKDYLPIQTIPRNLMYALIMNCNTQLGGAFWFFYTLLIISVGYCLIDFILKRFFGVKNRHIIQFIIAIVFLGIGYWFKLSQITLRGLNLFFSYYCLFYLGHMMKTYKKEDILKKYSYLIAISSLALLLVLYLCGVRISLGANSYVNPAVLLAASVSGWYFLNTIIMILERYNCKQVISLFTYVGRNTLCIMVLHFLCFKLVNYCLVHAWNLPACATAAFPVLTDRGAWWILYTISGILLPLLIKNLLEALINRLGCSQECFIHLL